jgi:cAMP-binding proteins - catabolite gene activator and regulatory subunit of cAMP-dependent protein kinases
MSYSINKKIFPKGSVIATQGNRADFVVLVQKGTILIYQKLSTKQGAKKRPAKTSIVAFPGGNDQHHYEDQLVVDIAKIGSHDVFGIVEAVTKSKKMKREAVATTDVEAFLIQ